MKFLLISLLFCLLLTGCYTQFYAPPAELTEPTAPEAMAQPETVNGANVTIINENQNIMEYPPYGRSLYNPYLQSGGSFYDPYAYRYDYPRPRYRGGYYSPGSSASKPKQVRRRGSYRRESVPPNAGTNEAAPPQESISAGKTQGTQIDSQPTVSEPKPKDQPQRTVRSTQPAAPTTDTDADSSGKTEPKSEKKNKRNSRRR